MLAPGCDRLADFGGARRKGQRGPKSRPRRPRLSPGPDTGRRETPGGLRRDRPVSDQPKSASGPMPPTFQSARTNLLTRRGPCLEPRARRCHELLAGERPGRPHGLARRLRASAPACFSKALESREAKDLTHHHCIDVRLPPRAGLQAWEFEKSGGEQNAPACGQATFNAIGPSPRLPPAGSPPAGALGATIN